MLPTETRNNMTICDRSLERGTLGERNGGEYEPIVDQYRSISTGTGTNGFLLLPGEIGANANDNLRDTEFRFNESSLNVKGNDFPIKGFARCARCCEIKY